MQNVRPVFFTQFMCNRKKRSAIIRKYLHSGLEFYLISNLNANAHSPMHLRKNAMYPGKMSGHLKRTSAINSRFRPI